MSGDVGLWVESSLMATACDALFCRHAECTAYALVECVWLGGGLSVHMMGYIADAVESLYLYCSSVLGTAWWGVL